MGVCFSLGVTAAAAVQPEVVTSRDAHDIHHPAEKKCPVCGMSNYIEEMHASVECFKCRREGKHTVVTRDGATGLKSADSFATEAAHEYVAERNMQTEQAKAFNAAKYAGLGCH